MMCDIYVVKQRLCIFCKSMEMLAQEPAYSEYTPGTDFRAVCWTGKWRLDGWECSTEAYRQAIIQAESCETFELIDGLVEADDG